MVLASFLEDRGMLLVCDFRSLTGDVVVGEEYANIVPHRAGLSVAQMKEAFDRAGLSGFTCEDIIDAQVHGVNTTIFIAKAMRICSEVVE